MDTPKFSIGQKVKFIGEPDSEAGEIVSFSFHSDGGYLYQVSSKEVDVTAKTIYTGIKHAKESELEVVNGQEATNE